MIGKFLVAMSRMTSIPVDDVFSPEDEEQLARKIAQVAREHREMAANRRRLAEYIGRRELWRAFGEPSEIRVPRVTRPPSLPAKMAKVFDIAIHIPFKDTRIRRTA